MNFQIFLFCEYSKYPINILETSRSFYSVTIHLPDQEASPPHLQNFGVWSHFVLQIKGGEAPWGFTTLIFIAPGELGVISYYK